MEKIFTVIIIVLLSLFVLDSTEAVAQTKGGNTYEVTDYIGWTLSNNGCYGCASFYYKITKSKYTYNGYYLYDFWFYSNSTYSNGAWASTYVWGMYVTVDGMIWNSEPFWVTFREEFNASHMRVASANPYATINAIWQGLKVL